MNNIRNYNKVYETIIPELHLTYKSGDAKQYTLNEVKKAESFFKEIFDVENSKGKTILSCVFLNNSLKTIGWIKTEVSDEKLLFLDCKMILKQALKCNSNSIILGLLIDENSNKNINRYNMFFNDLETYGKILEVKALDNILIHNE